MSFLTDNNKYYKQLVEDLSIIDNVYDIFEEEFGFEFNDKEVLDLARHAVYKQQIINQIIQSETNYVNELYDFQATFATEIQKWLDLPEDKENFAKLKSTAKKPLEAFFQSLHGLSILHTDFLKKVSNRFKIWGPTQLISDILNDFYKQLTVYDSFISQHPEFIMALDILHRLPSLTKFLEATVQQLKNYSDPSNPDYSSLEQITEKFVALDQEWSERKQNCQAHLMVLEIYRSVENCPVTVTLNRRLILYSDLIKVDLEDVTATSDVRTYYLYSDHLIYCRKQKDKKDGPRKLVYKGSLNLRGAEIRNLQPVLVTKMCEPKKPLFKIKKKPADTVSLPGVEAFGFELITSEANIDAVAPMYFSNASMPPQMSSGLIKRRHILRTKSLEEQKTWYAAIEKVIKTLNQSSQKH
ncbi:hypothetical protein G6F62_005279 [Rhizopus arrhizus]|uniref:PH domain-containing protein n=1 Tax=Rhizopus oryzae TaxID=64495 RepID=A0A9P7BQ47_RHIOR|nr:hypothetical protein G6F24_008234 [Rhizopus arrhizus]KAG0807043.1 hypothetical protein G6F20_010652 [Rhizopus arrhizus]KAG0838157.1 hypothetical protein G6F18_004624 [Rhizopus arrhizus]KAG0852584.1 hypothetical protein G6F17_007981 [Rhizopus arrhizus]KAG0873900.1 hypothetical protein G6F15_010747 [Rhizopus arrhizus]